MLSSVSRVLACLRDLEKCLNSQSPYFTCDVRDNSTLQIYVQHLPCTRHSASLEGFAHWSRQSYFHTAFSQSIIVSGM